MPTKKSQQPTKGQPTKGEAKRLRQAERGFADIMRQVLRYVPLPVVLPILFNRVLSTIRNPDSENARMIEDALVEFAQAVKDRYPERFD